MFDHFFPVERQTKIPTRLDLEAPILAQSLKRVFYLYKIFHLRFYVVSNFYIVSNIINNNNYTK